MPDFLVEFRITGKATHMITADSLEEAEEKAEAMVSPNDDDWGEILYDLEEIDDCDTSVKQLYNVERDGRRCAVTYIRQGDIVISDPLSARFALNMSGRGISLTDNSTGTTYQISAADHDYIVSGKQADGSVSILPTDRRAASIVSKMELLR